MKIEKTLVQQIIKEEITKFKRLIILKEEKQNILKQLNELYEDSSPEMEEEGLKSFLGLELKTDEDVIKHLNKPENIKKKEEYEKLGTDEYQKSYPAKDPKEVLAKSSAQRSFIEFVKKHPSISPEQMQIKNGQVSFKGAEDVKYKQTGRELAGNPSYTHGGMAQHLGGWEQ
jgi:hypothetical protein